VLEPNWRLAQNIISEALEAKTGYTLLSSSVLYREGGKVFGTIAVKKNSGYFANEQETVCGFKADYAIKNGTHIINGGASDAEWNIKSIAYGYIGQAGISVKVPATFTTANVIYLDVWWFIY
jgi:hypothetical protein